MMKKHLYILPAAILSLAACSTEHIEHHEEQGFISDAATKIIGMDTNSEASGKILVKFDSETAEKILAGEIPEFITESMAESLVPALPVKPKNDKIARKYGLHKWFTMSCSDDIAPSEMAMELASEPEVQTVQIEKHINVPETSHIIPYTPSPLTRSGEDTLPFDDPMLADQWNLINRGNPDIAATAVAGADLGVKDAWSITGGDPRITVAVLDCAIKNLHPDLRDAVWVNEAEKSGTSGVDDDGNGFIDDVYGFNFVGCINANGEYVEDHLSGKEVGTLKGNRLNWAAGHGHGTHVAGIIGATNGNGKGVSSVAGGTGNDDGVRLMSLQIFQGSSSATDAQSAAAFIYAADNGASVANCSYGLAGGLIKSDDIYINGFENEISASPLEYAAMQYFIDPENANCEAVGGNIIVCSAGNESAPYASYPGALPFCISVTGIGPDYLPGGYTNYGPGCKITAPGGDFYVGNPSYELNKSQILSTGVSECQQHSGTYGDDYVYMQGTSMACPHVTGVVALGMSYALELGKKFSREEFISMLLTSVNDINPLLASGTKKNNDKIMNLVDYKGNMGTGAVDAWKFLMNIEGTPSFMAKTGETASIDLTEYFSADAKVEVEIDSAAKAALGISGDPVWENGMLKINCSKVGSGKVTLKSAVGKDTAMEGGINEMRFSKEISIVSRETVSSNGGWF